MMESATLPDHKRPCSSTAPEACNGTEEWSRAVLNRVRTAAEGLLDRMNLDDVSYSTLTA